MLPAAFLSRMQDMLQEEYPDFLEAFEAPPKKALRLQPTKGTPTDFPFLDKWQLRQVPWEPTGFYYPDSIFPGKHPLHEAGVYYIQEPSAMAPVSYLDVTAGQRVLDLCAAPGGKSTQIAGMMNGEGLLISNEIVPSRAKILSENIERMGVKNAIVTNESPKKLAERFPLFFDRILVDAPCSGEGMFRKNEEAMTEWSPENVTLCASRQDEILDCAASMLCPGGRMVYSTCTFSPEENEGSVYRFLTTHPDFLLIKVPLKDGMTTANPNWCKEETSPLAQKNVLSHAIRLFPHKCDGEGHFIAVFAKEGATSIEKRDTFSKEATDFIKKETASKKETNPSVNPFLTKGVRCKELQEFWDATMLYTPNGTLSRFGDQFYLLPPSAPSLDGLKVLRPGLHLGTLLKNRFVPSHALALASKSGEVAHVYTFSDEAAAISYIAGNTFPAEGEKGWYLLTIEGYSLAFGKLTGGVMKNHYPKGLRKNLHL